MMIRHTKHLLLFWNLQPTIDLIVAHDEGLAIHISSNVIPYCVVAIKPIKC